MEGNAKAQKNIPSSSSPGAKPIFKSPLLATIGHRPIADDHREIVIKASDSCRCHPDNERLSIMIFVIEHGVSSLIEDDIAYIRVRFLRKNILKRLLFTFQICLKV